MGFELNERKDEFIWSLNKRSFSVNSMYKDLMRENALPDFCVSWKLKLPLKIKVFLWYLKKGIIIAKDNLVKRNWKGCTKCCFCSREEISRHLFFDCHMSRFIWNYLFLSFGITPLKCSKSVWILVRKLPFNIRKDNHDWNFCSLLGHMAS